MAEDTTESDNPGKPKKTPTRMRTTAAGLVLSGMRTILEVATQAAARAESLRAVEARIQANIDSATPFDVLTYDGMDLMIGIPVYRKLEAIEAEAAAKVDHAPPASNPGPGEQREQDPQGMPAVAKPRAGALIRMGGPKRLTDKQRELVKKFYAVRNTIDFPGVAVWAGLHYISERQLLRLRNAYDCETHQTT